MKKNIILISALLATSNLYASSLEGFYATAGIGATNSNFNMDQAVQLLAPPRSNILLTNNGKGYDKHIAGTLGLGYLIHLTSPLALGIEAVAGFGNTEIHKTERFQEFNSGFNLSGKVQAKLKNNAALLFKPGVFIGSETFLYGLVGPRWGRFETASEANFVQTIPAIGTTRSFVNSGYSGKKTGVTAGVGIEHRFAKHWGIGLEYAYTHYGKLPVAIAQSAPLVFTSAITGNTTSGGTLIDTPQQIAAKTSTIMLTLSYKFL